MEKNITALFEINVPKHAKTLAKFVSKDTLRPQFCYVCLEPGRGIMAATDTRKLRAVNFEAVGEWSEGLQVLINPKHVAKIAGKTATVTVSEVGRAISVEIEADGEIYTTEYTVMNFPDVKRVIPPRGGRNAIRLTAENIEALKTICKLHKKEKYITLSAAEGDSRLIVLHCDAVSEAKASYILELADNAEKTLTFGLCPQRLLDCLTGCNGVLLVDGPHKPIMFEGEAEATILMPMCVNDRDAEFVSKVRDNSLLVGSTFADDIKAITAKLRDAAAECWQEVCTLNKQLTPGNYSATDIANYRKAKCGYYVIPQRNEQEINMIVGNISLTFYYSELFSILATWEAATKCPKMEFKVGDVKPGRKVSVMMFKGGTDEMTDKKVTISEVAPHIYTLIYKLARYGERVKIIFEIDGVYFQGADEGAFIMEREDFAEACRKAYDHARENIAEGAAKGTPYFVELTKRLEAARAEQEQPEDATEQEREFISVAETHRNAEGRVIAWEIYGNGNGQVIFENADKTRYTCAYVVKMDDGGHYLHFAGEKAGHPYGRTIYKRKTNALKGFGMTEGRNITQQPATAAETPQISAETVEAANVSAEGKKREETANIDEINNFISRSGFTLEEQFTHDVYRVTKDGKELTSWLTLSELWQWICNYKGTPPEPIEKLEQLPQPHKYRVWRFAKQGYAQIIVGDYSQWKVVAILSFVFGKTKIEVSDDALNIHTIGKKDLHINKPITELTDAEVLKLIYGNIKPTQPPKSAPQSTQIAPAELCHPDTQTPAEGKYTAKISSSEMPNNSPLYVTRYITPRNVCSTTMFHG